MTDVLSELKSLRHGWDGNNARGPNASAVKDVEAFLKILDNTVEITPLATGDISLGFLNEQTKELDGLIDFAGKGHLKFIHDNSDVPSEMPTKKRLMIDIETTALELDAAVWEIGYWEIGSDHDDVTGNNAFNGGFLLNPYEQLRIINDDTIDWLEHNCDGWPDAKKQFPNLESTSVLLKNFQQDVLKYGFDEIWCKGSDFDFAILRTLFRDYDIPLPWNYQRQCCMRSYLNTFPEFKQLWTANKSHSGMYDARSQAECIETILKYLDRY